MLMTINTKSCVANMLLHTETENNNIVKKRQRPSQAKGRKNDEMDKL